METENRLHPYQIMMGFLLIGLSSIFAIFVVSQLVTNISNPIPDFQIPVVFHANTIIILFCSYVMRQAKHNFHDGKVEEFRKSISITFGLGFAFLIFQMVGFWELFVKGVSVSNNLNGSYLYIIAGTHGLHVLAGLVPLAITLWNIRQRKKNAVKQIIYDTDPVSRIKIDLLTIYWHFVDGLWLFLYLFFWLIVLVF